ncbi:MAG: AraC family transcriptional regulator [Peptostreptococcus sp.]|uniref:AraC family transcriptional regulator n=1 Tax=Peptostreptococcus sp. TaxID=1262 RepID=UPI002FC5EAE4
MDTCKSIEFKNNNKEQLLTEIKEDFPLMSSLVELDNYRCKSVPWHWHGELEMFYVKSGEVLYSTPQGDISFPKGSGGLVNSNVLHATRANGKNEETLQKIHIFDPVLISGRQGNKIYRDYVTPLSSSQLKVIALFPENEKERKIIEKIKRSFDLEDEDFYELKIRNILSEIWCDLFLLTEEERKINSEKDKVSEKIKGMMIYIHDHYAEKLTVAQIAQSVYTSERDCYRTFREYLNTSPQEYLKSYRLQKACEMLTSSNMNVGDVGYSCGLGSSSYFGKVFREYMGNSPVEYRNGWQKNDIIRQK